MGKAYRHLIRHERCAARDLRTQTSDGSSKSMSSAKFSRRSIRSSRWRRSALGDDFECKTENRQILAGMIIDCGQLWEAVVVGAPLGAFVDRRVQIDEMPAWRSGRLHDDLD